MRTFIIVVISLMFCTTRAQNATKTITLHVSGNCGECKERIENAADIKGVKLCTWDEKTQTEKIIYSPDKVSAEQIEKAIAGAGHDAGSTKSETASYNKLPKCCRYREAKCEKK